MDPRLDRGKYKRFDGSRMNTGREGECVYSPHGEEPRKRFKDKKQNNYED
jgi:hypothetical protein